MSRRKTTTYHHGDLRRALLDAGLALLEAKGLEGLTLRRVAATAGVSHGAPAHYFPARKHLLTALAAIGFERFGTAMAAQRNRAAQSPMAQMKAAGLGYARFAIDNPGLFRLMFSKELVDETDPHLRQAAHASFAQLEEISRPVAGATGSAGEHDKSDIQKLVWCVVHGYAHLCIEGQMARFDGEARGRVAKLDPPDIAAYLFRNF